MDRQAMTLDSNKTASWAQRQRSPEVKNENSDCDSTLEMAIPLALGWKVGCACQNGIAQWARQRISQGAPAHNMWPPQMVVYR